MVLLDIEGTTTPVDFVYKTLFPYAARNLQLFLNEFRHDTQIQALLAELRSQNKWDESAKLRPPVWHAESADASLRSAVAYGRWLMARDSKCTPLKALQGRIWQTGYQRGELHGEVYPDVPLAFARWRKQRRQIAIYSSGSILAQKLLFAHTAHGDLTTQIGAFFDTTTGAKTAAESYRKIAAALQIPPSEILFLSDLHTEIAAARSAGMPAALCDRAATASTSAANDIPSAVNDDSGTNDDAGAVIHSFAEVFPD